MRNFKLTSLLLMLLPWLSLSALAQEHNYDENGICTDDGCAEKYQPAPSVDWRYEISNAGQLKWYADAVNNGTIEGDVRLVADIDLSVLPESWTPICPGAVTVGEAASDANPYWYVFDGQGHTIKNLALAPQEAGYAYGLFGTLSFGGVINLALENVEIVSADNMLSGTVAGGIAGMLLDGAGVQNCRVSGCTINGIQYAGGLVGMNAGDSRVVSSFSTGCSFESEACGGVVGMNRDENYWSYGSLEFCYTDFQDGFASDFSGFINDCEVLSSDQFASGEVAYKLNGSDGSVWYQTIGEDACPVLDNTHGTVYRKGTALCPNRINVTGYTNDEQEAIDTDIQHPYTEKGFCEHCDDCQPAERDMETDAWLVGNAGQLYYMRDRLNGCEISLTADIVVNDGVMNEETDPNSVRLWEPIDCDDVQINGNGHTISGLYSNSYESALIRESYGSRISQLGITNSFFGGSDAYKAASFVISDNYGWITNCYSTATVSANNEWNFDVACGLVCSSDGVIQNSYFAGKTMVEWGATYGVAESRATLNNVFVLEGAADNVTNRDADNQWFRSAEAFASGDLAFLLGTEYWGQVFGQDAFPSFANDDNRILLYRLFHQGVESNAYYNPGNLNLEEKLSGNDYVVVTEESLADQPNVLLHNAADNSYSCKNLVITDAEPFFCNIPFTAENAVFQIHTPEGFVWADGSNGWHTLCAPFSGQICADGEELRAFASNDDETGQYWLKDLRGYDSATNTLLFGFATEVEAGKPYIVALPGDAFGAHSLQGAALTLKGSNVELPATASGTETFGGYYMAGTLQGKASLNPDENLLRYQLNPEGNAFVATLDAVPAYQAYILTSRLNIGTMSALRIGPWTEEGNVTAISTVVSDSDAMVNVADASGRSIRTRVRAAEALTGLPAGMYIVNGKKVVK